MDCVGVAAGYGLVVGHVLLLGEEECLRAGVVVGRLRDLRYFASCLGRIDVLAPLGEILLPLRVRTVEVTFGVVHRHDRVLCWWPCAPIRVAIAPLRQSHMTWC